MIPAQTAVGAGAPGPETGLCGAPEREPFEGPEFIVLGQKRDPQIGAVTARLMELGVACTVIDYLTSTRCTVGFTDPRAPVMAIDDRRIRGHPVIWDRSKFFPGTAYYFDDVAQQETEDEARRRHQLQEVEWRGLYALLVTLPGTKFLNDPTRRQYMLKPVQQMVANELGLETPPSLVSNDRNAIEQYFEAFPDSILKSLSGGRFARSEDPMSRTDMLMTMKVTAADISAADQDAFLRAPHFFQERIEKAYEIRLFAYRGGWHAFRVDSQRAKFTSTDWRHGASFLTWEPCETPEPVASAVQVFLERFSLFYGSFDFVVTPEGRWVFLECNQDGQWAWLDKLVDQALSNGLAEAVFRTWFQLKSGAEP